MKNLFTWNHVVLVGAVFILSGFAFMLMGVPYGALMCGVIGGVIFIAATLMVLFGNSSG